MTTPTAAYCGEPTPGPLPARRGRKRVTGIKGSVNTLQGSPPPSLQGGVGKWVVCIPPTTALPPTPGAGEVLLFLHPTFHGKLVELLIGLGVASASPDPSTRSKCGTECRSHQCGLPMTPPRASISRTSCPFATPPMAGLQLICATASAFIESRTRFQAEACGGHRGFGSRVPCPHHNHIKPILQRARGSPLGSSRPRGRTPDVPLPFKIGNRPAFGLLLL